MKVFKAFWHWIFRHPISDMPTTSLPRVKPTIKELAAERRQHLEEQDRLRRLEHLYMQKQSIKRKGKGGEQASDNN